MGLHGFTFFPAFLEPTSLWGPGAALLRSPWCDFTLWVQLRAGASPWKQPEAAVQLAEAMCKSPINSLSCSPPSSNGPHRIIYDAQVGKTSSATQGRKAQGLLVVPPPPTGRTRELPSSNTEGLSRLCEGLGVKTSK